MARITQTVLTGGVNGGTSSGIDTTGATLLVLVYSYSNAAGTPTIADSNTNDWTTKTAASNSDLQTNISYAYAKSGGAMTLGSGHTFSITDTSGFISGVVLVYDDAGISSSADPFLAQATNNNVISSATSSTLGADLTPAQDCALVVFGCGVNGSNGGSVAAANGFTLAGSQNFIAATSYGIAAADLKQSLATLISNQNAKVTWASACNSNGICVAFKVNTVPDAPVMGTVLPLSPSSVTAPFTRRGDGGSTITGYTVTSSPAGGTDADAGTTGLSHTITGLTSGVAYTFSVDATNANGDSAASAASNSVTLTDIVTATPIERQIIQRSGTTGTIEITGSYVNTPTTIEARIVEHGTTTPLTGFDWQTKDASPSGGTFSFSFASVPQGGWYNVQVRFSNDTDQIWTTGKVGVGMLFSLTGQSFAEGWFYNSGSVLGGDSTLTANDLSCVNGNINNNALWTLPDTAAMNAVIQFSNDMLAAVPGVPVGCIDNGIGGSGLTISSGGNQWQITTAGQPYAKWILSTDAVGGKYEAVLWMQGQSDAGNNVSQASYASGLSTQLALFRTYTGQASLPIVLLHLPRYGAATSDAIAQGIRDAIIAEGANANNYLMSVNDFAYPDSVHPSHADMTPFGKRAAVAVKNILGLSSYGRGPSLSGLDYISSTVYDLLVSHRGGTDFTPSSAITDVRALDNTTPATVSSVARQSAGRIRVTLAGAPSGTPSFQYQYGESYAITGPVFDNTTEVLPLEPSSALAPTVPPAPTIGSATAGSGDATVAYTAPSSNGGAAITTYTATSSPGGFTGTGSSPITVSGLTNGVSYTFTLKATNSVGQSVASSASNSVTPSSGTGGGQISVRRGQSGINYYGQKR